MSRPVYEKMGITSDQSVCVIDGPAQAVAAMELPGEVLSVIVSGKKYDHIILFTKTQATLDEKFPQYRDSLTDKGKLWVAWPKAGKLTTDLTIRDVIRIGYNHGLVESVNLRIDDTWTALKFTTPKPGKTYSNSYGKLPDAKGM